MKPYGYRMKMCEDFAPNFGRNIKKTRPSFTMEFLPKAK
jgi:hypothetical protein